MIKTKNRKKIYLIMGNSEKSTSNKLISKKSEHFALKFWYKTRKSHSRV